MHDVGFWTISRDAKKINNRSEYYFSLRKLRIVSVNKKRFKSSATVRTSDQFCKSTDSFQIYPYMVMIESHIIKMWQFSTRTMVKQLLYLSKGDTSPDDDQRILFETSNCDRFFSEADLQKDIPMALR